MPDSEGGGTAEKRLHSFATQPGPDWNRESHGEWAGMKSYLGAGYAPYGLDKSHRGSLSGAALDRIRLIAKHDVVFATGHLGRDEIFAVVRGARELGVRKVIVTHAEFPSQNLSAAEQRELAKMGAMIEHCFTTMYTGKVSWEEAFIKIRETGFEHSLLSTDLGQSINPSVSDGSAMFEQRLLDANFTTDEIRRMAVTNSRELAS